MAIPGSGSLGILTCPGGVACTAIAKVVCGGGVGGPQSLCNMFLLAGFSIPQPMTNFHGSTVGDLCMFYLATNCQSINNISAAGTTCTLCAWSFTPNTFSVSTSCTWLHPASPTAPGPTFPGTTQNVVIDANLGAARSGTVCYTPIHCGSIQTITFNQLLNPLPVYGYWGGGYQGNVTGVVNTDRMTFSTSVSAANAGSNLTVARYSVMGISDGKTYGYFLGGVASAVYQTKIDRITFSTSATAANATNMTGAMAYGGSLGDGVTYGYFGGGSSGTNQLAACRLTFSTSAVAANASNLSVARAYVAGMSDGSTYGYFAGGNGTTRLATTDRVVFSTSVISANAGSNLSVAAYSRMGVSDGCTYGYFAGGNTTVYIATTDRIVFSTSTTSAYSSVLTGARVYHAGISSGGALGYWGGGYNGTTYTAVNIIDRITFSTGAIIANGNNLSNYNGSTSWAFFSGSGLSEFKA
jgi:hypothetical protein